MSDDYISREKTIKYLEFICKILTARGGQTAADILRNKGIRMIADKLRIPAANVVEIPATGIGDLSDGYHTFNGLYYQRMVLFAALVNAYNDRAWKSWKHEDGKPCFDGGWFIVGIDTPQGSYTYHYEDKYWNWFECVELTVAKHWDGHTEADVTRLLSLPDVRPVVLCRDCKHGQGEKMDFWNEYVGIECIGGVVHRKDWFCADGEKREES